MKKQFVSFEDVRPDLKRYYNSELNDGKLMSEISTGHSKKITMICDRCNKTENKNIRNYCNFPDRPFSCTYCKSISFNSPELVVEWDYEKNGKLSPDSVSAKSNRKLWWKCSKGHEWSAVVHSRTSRKLGCPYCSGYKITEENSLGHNFPELLKEWDYDKNTNISPFEIGKCVRTKIWWKCSEGHEWNAVVHSRTNLKSGCPKCKLSRGEKIINDWLTNNFIHFISQYYVNGRHYDIYIPKMKLFIEIHGIQHFKEIPFFNKRSLKEEQEIDRQKQEYAEKHGHYMMVDYREHDPDLTLERFISKFLKFLDNS
ncbi:zinc-ribbon domain-containing protein [Priestia megaterium]|uniref:zinc-ribbon domain-containing protein n=1 Tax=Priestia megaterium TaxID=1404 RepID=UPI00301E56BE